MIYPNALADLMREQGLDDPTLASMAGTTKQQIWKLRRGERKLTREWAERLAPHLRAEPQEVIGWRGGREAQADSDTRANVFISIGKRIQWAREYRCLPRAELARRLVIDDERLARIEAGTVEPSVFEMLGISVRLMMGLDFLIRGRDETLPFADAEAYRESAAQGFSQPPRMENGTGSSRRPRRQG